MLMIDDNKIVYQVLKRCSDLFPEWEDEGSRFWNRRTGEMITKDGVVMNDLVYRKGTKIIPYTYDGKELNFIFGSKY